RSWDLALGKELRTLSHSATLVQDLALFPDGKRLLAVGGFRADFALSGQAAGEALVVEVDGGVTASLPGFENLVKAAAFSPDGNEVLLGGDGPEKQGALDLWTVEEGNLRRAHHLTVGEGIVNALLFVGPGRAFFGLSDGTLRALDTSSGSVRTLPLHSPIS